MNRSIRMLVFCLAGSGLAAVATAQTASTPKPQAAKPPAATEAKPAPAKGAPAGAQGMIVAIDPVTKELRQPEAAEIDALTGGAGVAQAAAALAPVPAQAIQGPGGGVGYLLDNSSMVFMVVTKGPDGKLVSDCVTGEKAADAKVKGAQATTKKVLDDK